MQPQVLIVDDSLTVRMDLAEAFASIAMSTTACETLAAARRALAEQPFSLVVLDVLLPDGDGVELLREIKNTPALSATRVILLSTEAEVRDRVRGFRTGADEYVGKPYDRANVLTRARQLLGDAVSPKTSSRTKLLLIDDSLTFRSEFKAVLESAGYDVVTAENGEDGLRAAVAMRPQAVIVNGVLPGNLNGAAVIRRLKDDITLRNTPCLLLTATESTEDELRTYEAGADAYVRKGTDTELILARILALLRSLRTHVAAPAVGGLLGPKRILTVDDSPTYLHELDQELRQEGYDVIAARSGKEALELLEVQQVDCILLDLLMPELSGSETCQIIKKTQAWRNIPLLILTAVEEKRAMIEGINAGADDYISKADDFEVLKARVRAQLRRKQFEDEYRSIRDKLLQKEIEAAQAKASKEIAEARAAFEPLLRNEASFNTAVRIAHLGTWDWNLADNRQTWSDEQFRILGLLPGTVQPNFDIFLKVVHPDDRERVAAASRQAVSTEAQYQVDCRVVRPDGDVRHVVCSGEVFRDESGNAVRVIGTMLDITERKQAEEDLRKASLYTRSLIEASLDPLVTISPDGKITDVNQATEKVTGVARQQLIGSDFSDYFTNPEEARRGYKQVFASGSVKDYPLAIRHCSGGVTDVLYNASVFRNVAGEVEGVFASARDISERKRAEKKLQEQAVLLDLAHDAILVRGLDGKIQFWSRGARDLYGWSAEEAMGRISQELLHTEFPQSLDCLQVAIRESREWEGELRHVCRDGKHIIVASRWSLLRDERDQPCAIMEINRDITERKRAEEELRRASHYTRSLIEASLDPLVTISRDGKITDVNQATEKVTGVSRELLIGSDFSDYFTDPEKARHGYQEVFARGFVHDYPLAIRHVSGSITDVLYNASVFRDTAGEVEGVFAAARDITARKHAEEEVRKLNLELESRVVQRTAELEAANKELEAFSYSVSHDLRAPLRAVDGFSRILLEDFGPRLPAECQEHLAMVRKSALHMGNLIDDLLKFSRLGRQGLRKTSVEVGRIVDDAREDLRADFEGRQVELVMGELPACKADGQLLRQVFVNLISNALKYTRPRQVARIEIGALTFGALRQQAHPGMVLPTVREEETVYFVRDNGVGFDMRYADKLFGVFQRLHSREEFEGTGVGLATVQRIVHRHGGMVWAYAEVGNGAAFYFTLGATVGVSPPLVSAANA